MRGYVVLAAMVALSCSGCDDTVEAQDWRQAAVIDAAAVTLDVSTSPAEPLPVLPDQPEPTPAEPQESSSDCASGTCQTAVAATTTVTYRVTQYRTFRRPLLGRRFVLFRRCCR